MTGIIAQNVGRTSGLIKAASGGGAWTKIKEITASADSEISFVDGTDDVVLDGTYPIYVFKFINIHPETDGAGLTFQASTDSGSSYGVTATTTLFRASHYEDDSSTDLSYDTGNDQAQSTSFIKLTAGIGNDNDKCGVGNIFIFNPSSTTFVKHFMCTGQIVEDSDVSKETFCSGYFNTTSALDAFQFKIISDNMDSGDICLYGISS